MIQKSRLLWLKDWSRAGFAVDHAGDGEHGLHLATGESYDLAVIDILMPRLDGLSFLEQLRKRNINMTGGHSERYVFSRTSAQGTPSRMRRLITTDVVNGAWRSLQGAALIHYCSIPEGFRARDYRGSPRFSS
jgi:CheY-like chemotaxis protein